MLLHLWCALIIYSGINCFARQQAGPNKKFVAELAICIILWHEKSPIERPDAIFRVTSDRSFILVVAS